MATPDGPRQTILVVDDEDFLRRLMAEMLENQGYEVLTAADGEAALARAEAHPGQIDLVVTDLVMPRKTGLELLEARLLAESAAE
jgi:CheY-like chemotaxis protein